MTTPPNTQYINRPAQPKLEISAPPSRQKIRDFKELLEDPISLGVDQPPPSPPPPISQSVSENTHSEVMLGTSPRQNHPTQEVQMPLTVAPKNLVDSSQQIALQITNGPLAGLILQANWQGRKTLHVQVDSQDEELRARIDLHAHTLSDLLTDIFAVPVTFEVTHVPRK